MTTERLRQIVILTLRGWLLLLLIVALTLILGPTPTARAVTFTVTKTADTADGTCDVDCSLREAIIAANAALGPDIINVPIGTYTLTIPSEDEENAAVTGDLDITDDLTIVGAGAANTIIDGDSLDRVLHIISSISVEITDVTIQNGATHSGRSGAGIFNEGGMVMLTNSTVSSNQIAEDFGGGIFNDSGSVILTNSTISNNNGHVARGVGIYNFGGIVELIDSTVSNNTFTAASWGGGIFNDGGTVNLINSTVSGNNVEKDGGGIFNDDGTVTLTNNSIISNNNADVSGGGIKNDNGGTIELTDTTISDNSAGNDGGGIDNLGTVQLTNSLISSNSAGHDGGGIDNFTGSAVTLINSTVSDNSADNGGGGMNNFNGTVELINSSVRSNRTDGNGGGIKNFENGSVTLTGSTISGNDSAVDGGGISNLGTTRLINSTVSGNETGDRGGGIFNNGGIVRLTDKSRAVANKANSGSGIYNNDGVVVLNNSAISLNINASGGGGIFNATGSVVELTNSTVNGNSATIFGGGIFNDGTTVLFNSTVSGNTANFGGGIQNNTGTLELTNSTISDNSANVSGGGISNGSTVELINTIVADNVVGGDCSGPITSLGYNLLGNNAGCSFTPTTGDLVGTSDSPIDPRLGPLQDNGGSTETHGLLPGSPAIDAGSCNGTTADQRGKPRPIDVPSIPNVDDGCDIGAFELQRATLNVRAFIDGRSDLIIQCDTVHWYHLDYAAPGRHFDAPGGNVPTFLNGTEWCPGWPGDPVGLQACAPVNNESRCGGCRSLEESDFIGVPTLAAQPQTVDLDVIQARAGVTIIQQPNQSNGFTLIVEFNDNPPGGPDWYEINLNYLEDATAITLLSFTAHPAADHITLAWQTATEVDNAGFNLHRATAAAGPYTRLNDTLIPAQGDAVSGANYTYTDTDVVKGVTYYYKLEDVDIHGVSTFHGPVSATPGVIGSVYLPVIVK